MGKEGIRVICLNYRPHGQRLVCKLCKEPIAFRTCSPHRRVIHSFPHRRPNGGCPPYPIEVRHVCKPKLSTVELTSRRKSRGKGQNSRKNFKNKNRNLKKMRCNIFFWKLGLVWLPFFCHRVEFKENRNIEI